MTRRAGGLVPIISVCIRGSETLLSRLNSCSHHVGGVRSTRQEMHSSLSREVGYVEESLISRETPG